MSSPTAVTRARRNYPPLLIAFGVMLGILAILPSSLDLPQSNPAETLEYAPVPPEEDESGKPPPGNFASLGAATSGSFAAGTGGADEGPGGGGAAELGGRGKNPSTKRCVGTPPRQTEDPLSPPCVAHFSGDNFGATHRGVSASEARVVVYFDSGSRQVTSKGLEPLPPAGSIYDLGKPPEGEEFTFVTLLRAYQRHFNERYQTYDRFVRFFVQFGRPASAESRRADAVDALERVDPFAVVMQTVQGFGQQYVEVMTRRGVVTFSGSPVDAAWLPDASFRRWPGLLWSYNPSIEQRAANVSSHLCEQLIPHRVSYSGDAADIGKPRVIAISRTEQPTRPDKARYGRLVRDAARACGANIVYEAVSDNTQTGTRNAAADIATMRQMGVTTIIIAGAALDPTVAQGKAAAAAQYHPEIYLAGDNGLEGNLSGKLQEQSVWRNLRAVTTYVRVDSVEHQHCFAAAREGDPSLPRQDVRNYGCDFYPDLRQMFIGIQVAGPRLTPTTMDKGFHAIPRVASDDPTTPACFYEPGDYTCVKDSQVQWWDPTGRTSDSSQPGCMRMIEGGRRYVTGTFPREDVGSRQNPGADPCNIQARDAA